MTQTELPEQDIEAELIAEVQDAAETGTPLAIGGGGTKAFYGNPTRAGRVLDCTGHQGIVAYEPSELAITVRAGTRLAAVEALLAEHGQQFPFEPPHFGPTATIGGMVAAGLSGPRRPYAASVRDAVLGVRLLNGRGQALDFGGRVMKNVAGYDLSRLMAGSQGILGVLLTLSLKVTPTPVGRQTLALPCLADEALTRLQGWARCSLPITATAWVDDRLYVRVCGSEAGLAAAREIIGGTADGAADEAGGFWEALREQRLAFFAGEVPLWRLSVPPATPLSTTRPSDDTGASAPLLIEWGGALRWLRTTAPTTVLRECAGAAGGHATLFRPGGDACPADGVFTPLALVPMRLHRNLKQAFDPVGLFNPGRLFPEL